MKKMSERTKNILCNSLFIFLLFVFSISNVVFSSSVTSLNDAIFNHCLMDDNLFNSYDENFIFEVQNNNSYYKKNRLDIVVDKKPLLYASGDVAVNNIPVRAFESFPLHFSNEDKTRYHYLAQRIYLQEENEIFNEGYSIIVSTDLYKTLIGEYEGSVDKNTTIKVSYKGKTVDAHITNVFLFNRPFEDDLNSLFTKIYGNDYCFVNSNLSDELNLSDFSVLLNRTNYFKFFPTNLFKKTNYKSLKISSYYSTFSNSFYSQIQQNQKTRLVRALTSSFTLILSLACIVFLETYKSVVFLKMKTFNLWLVYSSVFVLTNVMIALLANSIIPKFYILLAGFGVSFLIYILVGIGLSIWKKHRSK